MKANRRAVAFAGVEQPRRRRVTAYDIPAMNSNRIIAGGGARLLGNKTIRKKIARIRRDVAARHSGELSRAGLFGRFIVRHRIRREIREEIDRLVPPDALYFGSGRGES